MSSFIARRCLRPGTKRLQSSPFTPQTRLRSDAEASSAAGVEASTSKIETPTTDIDESPRPLIQLPRPLGVHTRPSSKEPTWQQKRDDLLNQEKRMETRRHLVKQATQGYFNDFNRLGSNEGKTWLSPRALIKENQSLYFPDIEGTRLSPRESVHTTDIFQDRISLVALLTTKVSEEHVQSFTERSLRAHSEHPSFQFVQINIQENPLKSFLVSLFVNALKREVPEQFQSTYLISHQNMEFIREPIGMENKHVGYVYLVDENLKIRWAGCAAASSGEAEALEKCLDVLLRRLSGAKTSSKRRK